ncbi:MAG TPA: protein kinase, partial [Burkholderiaceae bacterium]
MATTHFKHYELRGALGAGGYGQVFEAWDAKLHRPVAVKRLHTGSGQQGDLAREARLAASLRHAAFVQIHAIEDDGDSHAIVMELVPGQTVRELAVAGGLPEAQAIDIVRQVAQAMQAAHDAGLVHGDLKPSNLIVEPSGQVRILDFGLASRIDPQATTSMSDTTPLGTVAYMAPERLLGAAPDQLGDIYALGVMLYELLTGSRPFASLNGLALAAAHMQSSSEQWQYPPALRPQLVDLIRDMTARARNQRVASMREVEQRIAALDASRLPVPHLRQLAPRTRNALRAGAVVAVLAVAGWQAAPYFALLPAALTPYSEAVTMQSGLEALRQFDRPGNIDLAIKQFERVLEHNAKSAGAAAGLALAYGIRYASDGNDDIWLQKAAAASQQALQLDNQLALAYAASGWVSDRQGRAPQAQQAYDRALALDPSNFFASYGKVVALRRQRRYDEAMALAQAGLKSHPGERIFADSIGSIHNAKGDYKAAEQAFRDSLRMQPDAVIAYANLSAALQRQKRNDEALQVLQ